MTTACLLRWKRHMTSRYALNVGDLLLSERELQLNEYPLHNSDEVVPFAPTSNPLTGYWRLSSTPCPPPPTELGGKSKLEV